LSLIVATYSTARWGRTYQFELEAQIHRVKPIARVEVIPDKCVKASHFVPWFLLDILSEADPDPVVYIHHEIQLTADLIRAVLESGGADMAMAYRDKQPTAEVIYLANIDITRDLLDAWVEQNDRNPGRDGEVNLREVVRR
jgi:hypothetical protein